MEHSHFLSEFPNADGIPELFWFHIFMWPLFHSYSYGILTWGNLNLCVIYREWVCGGTAQEGNRVDAGLQQSCYFAQIESQWHSLSISQ